MEGDLDLTVREDELDEKCRPLIHLVKPVEWLGLNAEVNKEWEEDEEDEDVNFMDLDESGDNGGNGSEDSDKASVEEEIDEDDNEDVQRDRRMWRAGRRLMMMSMREEGETCGSGLGSRMGDLGRRDSASSAPGLYCNVGEEGFLASTQEIGERLLGRAMTPKDFFTSPEDQQDSIESIVTKRKRFLAGNARLIIDLEAAARKDAEEQGIDIEEMDRIDREMDRQALLNMATSAKIIPCVLCAPCV